MIRRLSPLLALFLANSAFAQSVTIQYDEAVQDSQAAITCGFCAGEKYGVLYYALPGNTGLLPSMFPLTLENVQIAVASTRVTGDALSGFQCVGDVVAGMAEASLEIYAGATPPANIANLPPTGVWPGETSVFGPMPVMLERSVEMGAMGSGQWDVRLNSVPIGVMVAAPNTYLRVVITIPAGGVSASCSALGFQPPGISPFRDANGRIGNRRNFIYQVGFPQLGIPAEWTWSEAVQDPITGGSGIGGDWIIRLDVAPQSVAADAGVPEDTGFAFPDAAPVDVGFPDQGFAPDAEPSDSGFVPVDAGFPDSGAMFAAPIIDQITPRSTKSGSSAAVTVTGSNFVAGLTLRVGAILATGVELAGSTTINATVPEGIAVGVYDVVVTNPDGQSDILVDGFTVEGATGAVPPEEGGCGCNDLGAHGSWLTALVLLPALFRRRR